jgi:flagellar hook-length control protein FliK
MNLSVLPSNVFNGPAQGGGLFGAASPTQWGGQFQQSLADAGNALDITGSPAQGSAARQFGGAQGGPGAPQSAANDANQASPKGAGRASRKDAKGSNDPGTGDRTADGQAGGNGSQAAAVSGSAAATTDGSGKNASRDADTSGAASKVGDASAGKHEGSAAGDDASAVGRGDTYVDGLKANAAGTGAPDAGAASDAQAATSIQPDADGPHLGANDKSSPAAEASPSANTLLGTDAANMGANAAPVVHATGTGVPAPAVNAAAANAPATAATPGEDPNTVRVARAMQSALSQGGGSVTLRLQPPDLGMVRVQMQVQDGVVRAQLTAEHDSVRDLLNQQLGHLRTALESHGLTVDRLDVQTAPRAPGSTLGGQQSEQAPQDGRSRGQYTRQDTGGGQNNAGQSGGQTPRQPGHEFEQELVNLVA